MSVSRRKRKAITGLRYGDKVRCVDGRTGLVVGVGTLTCTVIPYGLKNRKLYYIHEVRSLTRREKGARR